MSHERALRNVSAFPIVSAEALSWRKEAEKRGNAEDSEDECENVDIQRVTVTAIAF